MNIFFKLLSFLNLLDSAGTSLSITNIALIVVITKLGMTATFDWPTASALLLTLLNYAHKRVSNQEDTASIDPSLVGQLQSDVDKLKSNMSVLSINAGIKNIAGK